jgi:hypothetical protein
VRGKDEVILVIVKRELRARVRARVNKQRLAVVEVWCGV